ncbi:MAG: hypothetical protein DDT22_00235 [candidate division WS2 bacterium]|nr:hypothetical protein [Candidatus Lithacetigena glycinireducens]
MTILNKQIIINKGGNMILPEGYSLRHGSHYVFLYAGEEKIAVFSSPATTIKEIERKAWYHYDMKNINCLPKIGDPKGRTPYEGEKQ